MANMRLLKMWILVALIVLYERLLRILQKHSVKKCRCKQRDKHANAWTFTHCGKYAFLLGPSGCEVLWKLCTHQLLASTPKSGCTSPDWRAEYILEVGIFNCPYCLSNLAVLNFKIVFLLTCFFYGTITHTHVQTHTNSNTFAYAHLYMHAQVNTHSQLFTYVHAHTHTHAHVHAHAHALVQVHPYTRTWVSFNVSHSLMLTHKRT